MHILASGITKISAHLAPVFTLSGSFLGRLAYVPSSEDVVVAKLLWYKRAHRQKDLGDIKNVISVQRDVLDRVYLSHSLSPQGRPTIVLSAQFLYE